MLMREVISTLVGAPVYPIPLTACRVNRPYLLERAGISMNGTALLFAIPYLIAADAHAPERNLSLYAVPRDYHLYIKQLSDRVLPALREVFPPLPCALFSDHSPLLEADAAARAGMGVIGLNHMLITPTYGSFVFIAEVVVDADYATVTGQAPGVFPDTPPTCPGCGACIRACPAIYPDGRMIRPCLSALTQQKKDLTEEETRQLESHPLVWGCDTCQLVCPLNRAVLSGAHDTPIPFFRESRMTRLTSEELESMTDEAFAERAFSWRGKAPLRRNLTIRAESHVKTEEAPC